jgi:hypothetical protein
LEGSSSSTLISWKSTGAAGQVGHLRHVRRAHHPRAVEGDVGEDAVEVDVLLLVGVDHVVVVVAGDGQHRLPVQLGVVEAVEEVQPARTGGGQADPQAPRPAGVPGGHEGGGLFVADLDEADLVLAPAQGLHDPVDPVSGEAEDHLDAPFPEPLYHHVARRARHPLSPPPHTGNGRARTQARPGLAGTGALQYNGLGLLRVSCSKAGRAGDPGWKETDRGE